MSTGVLQGGPLPTIVSGVFNRTRETEASGQNEATLCGRVVKAVVNTAGFLKNSAGARTALSSATTLGVFYMSNYQVWPFTLLAVGGTSYIAQKMACSEKDLENALWIKSNIDKLRRNALKDSFSSMSVVTKDEPWVACLSEKNCEKLQEDIEQRHLITLSHIASSNDQSIADNMKAASKNLSDLAKMVMEEEDFCDKARETGLSVINTSFDAIQTKTLEYKNTEYSADRRRAVEEFCVENKAIVDEAKAALKNSLAENENEEVSVQSGGRSALNQTHGGVRHRGPRQASNGDST